jgi:hypothetical protein
MILKNMSYMETSRQVFDSKKKSLDRCQMDDYPPRKVDPPTRETHHLPLVVLELVLEVAVRLLLVGVVLVVVAVVLVVQLLGVLAGVALGALAVDEVGSLGLGELVDLGGGEARDELLGELVGDGLACGVGGLVDDSCAGGSCVCWCGGRGCRWERC